MYREGDPETITQEELNFGQVSDDVNALCWVPDSSGTDLLAATMDSLLICDIRAPWAYHH